ncbi:unnamed protein product [Protopolystoma xenopodis]|uniref:Uncharacterized protein n=1 Tax=Protopolystoma xenopodis TaxID=117903 RepID=A0A448WS56_9PLAT|nr:unnamed protein product [Protopolystoma xenopodis]
MEHPGDNEEKDSTFHQSIGAMREAWASTSVSCHSKPPVSKRLAGDDRPLGDSAFSLVSGTGQYSPNRSHLTIAQSHQAPSTTALGPEYFEATRPSLSSGLTTFFTQQAIDESSHAQAPTNSSFNTGTQFIPIVTSHPCETTPNAVDTTSSEQDDNGNLGVSQSFMRLSQRSDTDCVYVDQQTTQVWFGI